VRRSCEQPSRLVEARGHAILRFVKMATLRDLRMFPGASDVVRVGTRRWTKQHAETLGRILQIIERFLRDRAELPFEELLREFEENDVRVRVGGGQFAHILYGPRTSVSQRRRAQVRHPRAGVSSTGSSFQGEIESRLRGRRLDARDDHEFNCRDRELISSMCAASTESSEGLRI